MLLEAKNGSKFTLEYDGNKLYHFCGGIIPREMQGSFTAPYQALTQFKIFDGRIKELKHKKEEFKSEIEELELLSKKDDLVFFSQKEGIELPEGMSQPAAIKKFLKAELDKRVTNE